MKYVSIPIILCSFFVGLAVSYILGTEKNTVYMYPNPATHNTVQYQDLSGTCFKYNMKPIKCPINPFAIKTIPNQ